MPGAPFVLPTHRLGNLWGPPRPPGKTWSADIPLRRNRHETFPTLHARAAARPPSTLQIPASTAFAKPPRDWTNPT